MRKIEIGKGRMKVPGLLFKDPDELAVALARKIARLVRVSGRKGRKFLLGCPSGRSPLETYRKFAEIAGSTKMDLSHLVLVMMDEYVQKARGGRFEYPPDDAHYSCHRFARVNIFDEINRKLPAGRRIKEENVWFPEISDPSGYDSRIRRAGGVDLFILASGASDLHVAFNPPGSSRMSASRIIELSRETRQDNMGTFPSFKKLSEVPTHGISVGFMAISRYSKELAMVIHGRHKKYAVDTLNRLKGFNSGFPASIIYSSKNATVWLDAQAWED